MDKDFSSLPSREQVEVLAAASARDVVTYLDGGARLEAQAFAASNDYPFVRARLAGLEDLYPDVARILAEDLSEGVRATIAERTDLTPDLIWRLAKDPVPSVRSVLAANHTIEWSPQLPATFVSEHHPSYFDAYLAGADLEAVGALTLNWEGSLADLSVACRLVTR